MQNDFAKAMAELPSQRVASMVHAINKALDRRIDFEVTKNPNAAHIELREADKQIRNNATFARFLLVCGADPDTILNKVRKQGQRANLKNIRKLRMLAEYCAGKHGAINAVTKSLLASTIVAANRQIPWLSNAEQVRILSDMRLNLLPDEIAQSIMQFNHKYLKSSAESQNQASQFRTAFENLGCYTKSREDDDNFSQTGIHANINHPLMSYLNNRWNLRAVD